MKYREKFAFTGIRLNVKDTIDKRNNLDKD